MSGQKGTKRAVDPETLAALAETFPGVSPMKRQNTLGFKPISKDEQMAQLQAEDTKYKEAKDEAQTRADSIAKAAIDVASVWGLTWPRPAAHGPSRKGGPKPKSQKWEDGLYVWVHKISRGELSAPAVSPPKTFPQDWNPEDTPVWEYVAPVEPHQQPPPQNGETNLAEMIPPCFLFTIFRVLVLWFFFGVACRPLAFWFLD